MIYLIKHTRKNNNFNLRLKKYFLVVIVAFVLSLSLSKIPFLNNLVSETLFPVLRAGSVAYKSSGGFLAIFSDNAKLAEQNQELLSQIEMSKSEEISLETLREENMELRKELGMKGDRNLLAASIISKPPQIPLDTLYLDTGKENGVSVGDMVLVGERVLLGKVEKVSDNTSVISLSSLPGISTVGFIERTSEQVEVQGAGGGSMEAEVPIDFDIREGDKVLSYLSFNSILGVVGAVEENQSSGFKKIFLSLPSEISKIRIVFIEKTPK